jgi:hypothetical protein
MKNLLTERLYISANCRNRPPRATGAHMGKPDVAERGQTNRANLVKGPTARARKSADHAAALAPILARIEAEGRRSLGAIARALTAEGIPTAAGARNWTPGAVARVKARLAA